MNEYEMLSEHFLKCLVCGEKMPTLKKKVRMRNSETGDYEVYIECYDTSKDGWFIRLDIDANKEGLIKELYSEAIRLAKNEEIKKLITNLNAYALNPEFKDILFDVLAFKIEEKYEWGFKNLKRFIERFTNPFPCYDKPKYAAHTLCLKPILQSVDEKNKYIVENGKEIIVRAKKYMSWDELLKTFKYLSEKMPNYTLPSPINVAVELRNFLEYSER